MANIKKDGQMHKSVPIGPMVAGITGVAIGATAIALSSKKVRKQAGKALEQAVDQGKEALIDLQDRVYMQVKQLGKRAKHAIEKERAKTTKRLALHATVR